MTANESQLCWTRHDREGQCSDWLLRCGSGPCHWGREIYFSQKQSDAGKITHKKCNYKKNHDLLSVVRLHRNQTMFENQFINLLWETAETYTSVCGQHILAPGGAKSQMERCLVSVIWHVRCFLAIGQENVIYPSDSRGGLADDLMGEAEAIGRSFLQLSATRLHTCHICAHLVYLLPSD